MQRISRVRLLIHYTNDLQRPYRRLCSTSNHSSHNLQETLLPDAFIHNIQQRITYYREDPPDGGQLVLNIARSIFLAWTASHIHPVEIKQTKIIHWSQGFTFTYRPSLLPGVKLRPVEISMVLRRILDGLFSLAYWPGHVGAMIYDGDPEYILTSKVGSISIDHDPSPRGTKSALSAIHEINEESFPLHGPRSTLIGLKSNDVDNTSEAHGITNIGMPAWLERTWLECFAGTILWITGQMHWRDVTDPFTYPTEASFPAAVTINNCVRDPTRQYAFKLEIFWWGADRVRWQEVAKAMLEWATRVIRTGDGYWAGQDMILEERLAARFWMVNDPRPPSIEGLIPS